MINLKISGRMGNQFFQYAAVKSYLLENGINEKINISFEEVYNGVTDDSDTFYDYLKYFKVDEYNTIEKVHYTFYQKILDIYFRGLIKISRMIAKLQKRPLNLSDFNIVLKRQKKFNKNGLYYYIPGMKTYYPSKNNNIIFFGSYEDHTLFDKYYDIFLKDLKPKKELKESSKNILKMIKNSNSVCLNIRLGDFLLEKFKKNYYICTPKYFNEAIKQIKKDIPDATFFVFSSNVDIAKEMITLPENVVFEAPDSEVWENIYLMSNCKNFVISNSTFSWWGQYLSIQKDKKVYAPSIWNNFEFCDLIYLDDWKLIDVSKNGDEDEK